MVLLSTLALPEEKYIPYAPPLTVLSRMLRLPALASMPQAVPTAVLFRITALAPDAPIAPNTLNPAIVELCPTFTYPDPPVVIVVGVPPAPRFASSPIRLTPAGIAMGK